MNSTAPAPVPVSEDPLPPIVAAIRKARRVQVIGHVRPDGDCIGSILGVHYILEHFKIEHALAAEKIAPTGYEIFPGFSLIESAPRAGFSADLTIFVDSADRARAFEKHSPEGLTINIDHHATNTRYGQINWIDPARAAVGEMIYLLARAAGVPISADFANILLLAILTDTGSFRYSNTSPETFAIAGELVRAGANISLVAGAAYENKTFEAVRLVGQVFSTIRLDCGGRLAWSEIREPMLRAVGGQEKIPENLASELRGIKGVEAAAMFIETSASSLRASLRANGAVDVSAVAQPFKGGGHPNAAGITIEDAPYEAARDKIIEALAKALG